MRPSPGCLDFTHSHVAQTPKILLLHYHSLHLQQQFEPRTSVIAVDLPCSASEKDTRIHWLRSSACPPLAQEGYSFSALERTRNTLYASVCADQRFPRPRDSSWIARCGFRRGSSILSLTLSGSRRVLPGIFEEPDHDSAPNTFSSSSSVAATSEACSSARTCLR